MTKGRWPLEKTSDERQAMANGETKLKANGKANAHANDQRRRREIAGRNSEEVRCPAGESEPRRLLLYLRLLLPMPSKKKKTFPFDICETNTFTTDGVKGGDQPISDEHTLVTSVVGVGTRHPPTAVRTKRTRPLRHR